MSKNYEGCYFCDVTNPNAVEEHHIVPQRYNGSNEPENLVDLCGSCHNKIENQMYTDRFYKRLGVAVDELERVSDRVHSGKEVDPQKSQDRKIPKETEHVVFEEWSATAYISDIRNNDVQEQVSGLIDSRKEEILEMYEQHVQEQSRVEQGYDSEPDVPKTEGVPPLTFEYDHDLTAEYPVLFVKNPRENWIDWEHEDAPEYVDTRRRINSSLNERAPSNPIDEPYSDYYRLHCGYCHTTYTQHQHSDMARHLRVRHGIENPYEEVDTTFGEKPESVDLDFI